MDMVVCEKKDALDYLADINATIYDMSFADPPFNLNKKYDSLKDQITEPDYLVWCAKWVKELVRVTKPGGSIFIHHIPVMAMHLGPMLLAAGCTFRSWITWKASSGPMGKSSLQPDNYPILHYIKNGDKPKFFPIRIPNRRCRTCGYLHKDYGGKKHTIPAFGPLASDVWDDIYRVKHKTTRQGSGKGEWLHPCVLPVPIMERLILMCTEERDWVLDVFMGSGTTAAACKRLNREPQGCDISPAYVRETNRRYNHEVRTEVGERPVSIFRNEIVTIREEDLESVSRAMRWPEKKTDLDFACPTLSRSKKMILTPKIPDAGFPMVKGKPPYSLTAGTKDKKEDSES